MSLLQHKLQIVSPKPLNRFHWNLILGGYIQKVRLN